MRRATEHLLCFTIVTIIKLINSKHIAQTRYKNMLQKDTKNVY